MSYATSFTIVLNQLLHDHAVHAIAVLRELIRTLINGDRGASRFSLFSLRVPRELLRFTRRQGFEGRAAQNDIEAFLNTKDTKGTKKELFEFGSRKLRALRVLCGELFLAKGFTEQNDFKLRNPSTKSLRGAVRAAAIQSREHRLCRVISGLLRLRLAKTRGNWVASHYCLVAKGKGVRQRGQGKGVRS